MEFGVFEVCWEGSRREWNSGSAENELEEQLLNVGNRILAPPSSVDELLPLLDQAETLLSRVEQTPSRSMIAALHPAIRGLTFKELLGHSDIDVKVAVTSCISEITRFSAPEAMYDDDFMKVAFEMIVESFRKLEDRFSRSFLKRVSILETVAKVRSFILMLELECDSLILEMFQHFLNTIRDDHPYNVFSSMETIMTSVLEENDDISSDLLSSLLMSVKKKNKNILPIARELAEKVIGNCALKLKPYLMEAIQSMGAPLDDYGKLVAFICKENLYVLEQNGIDVSGECLKYRYIRTVSIAATSTMGALDTPHGEEDMMMVFSPTKTSPIMAVDATLSPPILSKEGAKVGTEGMMMVFSPTNTSPPPDKEHPSTVETTCPAIPALVDGISETSESFPALGIEWPDNPQFQAGLGDQELADQLMRRLDRLLHVDPLLAIDDMRNQLERCTRGYHAFGCPKDVWMAKLTTIWKEFARLSAVQARKQKAQLMLQEEEEGLRHLEATRNEVQARAETVEGRAQELRGEAQTLLQRAREAEVEAVALRRELGELRSKIFQSEIRMANLRGSIA